MNRRLILWFSVIAAAIGSPLPAQEAAEPAPKVILIRPAAEPTPALRYRLFPERRDLIPGNAAIFYHRAIWSFTMREERERERAEAQKTKSAPGEPEAYEDPIMGWLELPLDQLPRDEVRRYLESRSFIFNELEQGTRRETCDWELRRRDEGYSLLLPEIQYTRYLARLLALRVRLDIAEGRTDAAIQGIRMGLTLAHHVGQGDSLFQPLVAAAIANQFADALEELVQTPGCPNLYWALTALPRPFIDLRGAVEGEKNIFDREFPFLRSIEGEVWSLETARTVGDELPEKMTNLLSVWPPVAGIETPRTRAAVIGLIARSYSEARRALVAEGVSTQRVEAMPAIQAVLLDSYRKYLVQRDELFKWLLLPYWRVNAGAAESSSRIFKGGGWGIPFGPALLPAVEQIAASSAGVDRRFATLRVIEGVRGYAASHDGALPPDLAALSTTTPAPDDSGVGKPFSYKVEGGTAALSGPAIISTPGRLWRAVHVELKPAG